MGGSTTFADGICDYCDSWYYPVSADGEYDREGYITYLRTEVATVRELAPNSKFIWVLQAFGSEMWDKRLPTPEQLTEMAALAAEADLDGIWWYPWTFSDVYEQVLGDSPELQQVIADSAELFDRTSGGLE